MTAAQIIARDSANLRLASFIRARHGISQPCVRCATAYEGLHTRCVRARESSRARNVRGWLQACVRAVRADLGLLACGQGVRVDRSLRTRDGRRRATAGVRTVRAGSGHIACVRFALARDRLSAHGEHGSATACSWCTWRCASFGARDARRRVAASVCAMHARDRLIARGQRTVCAGALRAEFRACNARWRAEPMCALCALG